MSKWQIGETVQAGFMNVIVKAELTDNVYICVNQSGTQFYKFIPYNGIHKLTIEQTKALMESDQRRKAIIAQTMANIAAQRNEVNALFA